MNSESRKKHVCPAELSFSLDNAFRRWIHNPDKILKDYASEGMVILDVGCGPGLFSVALARMVGSKGKVIAADLQEAMLDKLKKKITGTELESRVELHKTGSDTIKICEKLGLKIIKKEKIFFSRAVILMSN